MNHKRYYDGGKRRDVIDYSLLAALKKYNYRCCWCGYGLAVEYATKEHIRPKIMGGTNCRENIAAAHKICNQKRSSDIWQDPHPSFLFDDIRMILKGIRSEIDV